MDWKWRTRLQSTPKTGCESRGRRGILWGSRSSLSRQGESSCGSWYCRTWLDWPAWSYRPQLPTQWSQTRYLGHASPREKSPLAAKTLQCPMSRHICIFHYVSNWFAIALEYVGLFTHPKLKRNSIATAAGAYCDAFSGLWREPSYTHPAYTYLISPNASDHICSTYNQLDSE